MNNVFGQKPDGNLWNIKKFIGNTCIYLPGMNKMVSVVNSGSN